MPVVENHQPDWKRAWLRRLAAPAVMLVIGVLFHWKLVLTNQYTWLETPDLSSLVLPWFQFQASEWHAGRFPMWEPYSWTGQPLFGQGQPGAAYPLNWLLFWMPLNEHGWLRQDALHWYYVLIHVLAAWTCYALARELGRSRRASVIAGCIYSLGGYVAYTDWPQMLHGAVWAPLVFLYLFRVARGERVLASSLLSGFFLGVAWLVGHHQLPLLMSLTAGFLWLWIMYSAGSLRPAARILRYAAAAFGITAMTGAFQTLPMAEYGRGAVRWVGAEQPEGLGETVSYELHKPYALKPLSLLGLVITGVEHNAYDSFVGGAALTLGILGAILAWSDRRARWLAAISLGGILFALGPNSIFHGILYAVVPMINKARVPEAGALMFTLGLAPLAAFGVDLLPGNTDWSRRAGWILGGAAAVLILGSLFFYAGGVTPAVSDNRMMITALVAVLMAAVLGGWRAGGLSARAGSAAILGLVLLELGNVTDYWLPYVSDKAHNLYLHKLAEHSDLARYIRGEGDPGRLTYDDKEIPYNIGDWLGVEAFNAYTASVPASLWAQDVFSDRVQDILGIRYYLGKQPSRPDQRLAFQGASGVNVYENPGAFPRVWSAHGARKVAGEAQARELLADPGFDARNIVYLIGGHPPPLTTCAGDEVTMPHHEPNYVKIEAHMQCRGMVILTDTWYPGWQATVDGKRAKIEKAYGFVRGVVVEMRYRPWSVYVGGALSLLACAIVGVAALRER